MGQCTYTLNGPGTKKTSQMDFFFHPPLFPHTIPCAAMLKRTFGYSSSRDLLEAKKKEKKKR